MYGNNNNQHVNNNQDNNTNNGVVNNNTHINNNVNTNNRVTNNVNNNFSNNRTLRELLSSSDFTQYDYDNAIFDMIRHLDGINNNGRNM